MKTKKPEPTFTQADKDTLKGLGYPVCDQAHAYIEHLEAKVKSLEGFYRGVSEALNSGDGTYRP